MIKTLHITGAVAVVLAVVVVASVLGFLRPTSFMHLQVGARGDKQIEKILGGSSAVDRFKEKNKGRVPNNQDTTPPLVKQALAFADILNPPATPDAPRAEAPNRMPPKPSLTKPLGPVSTKFNLLGTCYSSNPETSLAYIRLPDNTCQWVAQGSEIGHVTIKEIRKGSIVYWDGSSNAEMPVEATPDTSGLLEAGVAPTIPAAPLPRPTVGAKASSGPVNGTPNAKNRAGEPKPVAAPNRGTVATSPAPLAQISKEEQQALGDLGNRLKAGSAADPAGRNVAADKLIADYKAARAGAQEGERVGDPNEQPTSDTAKDSMREGMRRMFMKKLGAPRSPTK